MIEGFRAATHYRLICKSFSFFFLMKLTASSFLTRNDIHKRTNLMPVTRLNSGDKMFF